MSAALEPVSDAESDRELTALVAEASQFLVRRRADNTRRAYAGDWRDFETFCARHRLDALPASPATVGVYITHLARGLRASTIKRRLATISRAHTLQGLLSPTADPKIRDLHRGIRNSIGTAPTQRRPLLAEELRAICHQLPDTVSGDRDRALLVIGEVGALRRSELVALDVAEVLVVEGRVEVTIARSKSDQEGAGHTLHLPASRDPRCCPVQATRRWLDVLGASEGPLFRPIDRWDNIGETRLSGHAVPELIRRLATRAHLHNVKLLGGHSLRAGLITELAAAGVPDHVIALQSRHVDLRVLRQYVRLDSLLGGEAARALGL